MSLMSDRDYNSLKLARIPDNTHQVFKQWSGIPDDEIIPHIVRIHDEALKKMPYGCIGAYIFLHLYLPSYPTGPDLISRITGPEQALFLDVGCCLAQDIRHLVTIGAPPSNVFGTDYQQAFLDLGHELFRDSDRLKKQFVAADLINDDLSSRPEAIFSQKYDIIHAANFLHLFTWDIQLLLAKKLWGLLSEKKGSVVVGTQAGHEVAGEYEGPRNREMVYRHDKESFERMWREAVGDEKLIKCDVSVGDIRNAMPDGLVVEGDVWGTVKIREGSTRLIFRIERV